MIEYHEYLLSKEWKIKRKEVFARYGKACLKCRRSKRLHIHHKTYKRIFKENLDIDLIPLCDPCHMACHEHIKRKQMSIWHGTEDFLGMKQTAPKVAKLSKKERRRLKRLRKREKNVLNRVSFTQKSQYGFNPNSLNVLKREREHNLATKEKGKIDLHKFMQLYNLTEDVARDILKL